MEALEHQDAVIDRVARNVAERISVDERLRALGIEPAESQANFCWFSLGAERDEQVVMRGLQERGVLVRGGAALGGRGIAARDLRHARGERTLSRRACRGAVKVLQRPATTMSHAAPHPLCSSLARVEWSYYARTWRFS